MRGEARRGETTRLSTRPVLPRPPHPRSHHPLIVIRRALLQQALHAKSTPVGGRLGGIGASSTKEERISQAELWKRNRAISREVKHTGQHSNALVNPYYDMGWTRLLSQLVIEDRYC